MDDYSHFFRQGETINSARGSGGRGVENNRNHNSNNTFDGTSSSSSNKKKSRKHRNGAAAYDNGKSMSRKNRQTHSQPELGVKSSMKSSTALRSLTSLDLSSSLIGPTGTFELVNSICNVRPRKDCKLQILILKGNALGDQGACELAHLLYCAISSSCSAAFIHHSKADSSFCSTPHPFS